MRKVLPFLILPFLLPSPVLSAPAGCYISTQGDYICNGTTPVTGSSTASVSTSTENGCPTYHNNPIPVSSANLEALNNWQNVTNDLGYGSWSGTVGSMHGEPPYDMDNPTLSLTEWLRAEPRNHFSVSTSGRSAWDQLILAAWAQDLLGGIQSGGTTGTSGVDWKKLLTASSVNATPLTDDPATDGLIQEAWRDGWTYNGSGEAVMRQDYDWVGAATGIAQQVVDAVSDSVEGCETF